MGENPAVQRDERQTRACRGRDTAPATPGTGRRPRLTRRRGGYGIALALLVTLPTALVSPASAQVFGPTEVSEPRAPAPHPTLAPTLTPPDIALDLRAPPAGEAPRPKHASTLLLGSLYLSVSLSVLVLFPPDNWNGNITPHPSQFARSWSGAPTWHDGDPWTTNYVGHPIMGSVLYLFARRNDHSPVQAFLFSTIASTTWEYAFEAWYEQPSWSDLLVTSTFGALIGEGRWQLRQRLLRGGVPGVWGQVALFLVDPVTEIDILFFGFRT